MALGNYYLKQGPYDCARHYNEKAAELGVTEACYNLGWIYQNGLGCDANKKEALSNYLKAAQAGSHLAKFRIGLIYKDSMANQAKAMPYILDAAESGCREAAAFVGQEFMGLANSNHQPEHYHEAILFFEIAAHKGDRSCMLKCIEAYQKLAELIPEEAEKYLAKAEAWQTRQLSSSSFNNIQKPALHLPKE